MWTAHRRRTAPPLAGIVVLLLALPGPVRAQQSGDPGPVTLAGTVVDAATGEPIPGVAIRLDVVDNVFLTDGDGGFVVPDVPGGLVTLAFEQLGYAVMTLTQTVGPDPAPLRIELEPRPMVLEGLEVMVDRLKTRRYSAGVPVRVLGPGDFENDSRLLLWSVRAKGGLYLTTCRSPYEASYWCVYRRGGTIAPSVWIDDRYSFTGLDELELYWTDEIYMVEIYRSGAALRVYTRDYMQTVASRPRALFPAWMQ